MRVFSVLFLVFIILLSSPLKANAANYLDVVINEIAWMGTKANSSDEWIELYNNTDNKTNLDGWGLYENDTLIEPLTGLISANGYYLLERTDESTIESITASQPPSSWGGYGLNNSGEHLILKDSLYNTIDEVNCNDGWFAGEGKPSYSSMERVNPSIESSSNNWISSSETSNALDNKGSNIQGTPLSKNSGFFISHSNNQEEQSEEKPKQEPPKPKEKTKALISPKEDIPSDKKPEEKPKQEPPKPKEKIKEDREKPEKKQIEELPKKAQAEKVDDKKTKKEEEKTPKEDKKKTEDDKKGDS